jgi:ABC-type phosphate transport system substrate-binding protein
MLVGAAGLAAATATAAEIEFRVIVHPDVSETHVPREDLSAVFLGDKKAWADGQRVVPVDQSLRSPVREAFTREVLGEQMAGIESLWARRIARGVTPPKVKASDQDVIDYVGKTRGAIGYVSTDVSLPATVRILSVLY